MINLNEELTVILTTHVLPSAPSTYFIEATIKSIKSRFSGIEGCKFMIYCDSDSTNHHHLEYVENLRNLKDVVVVDNSHEGVKISGLQKNYIKALKETTTPFAFCCEHDWKFLRNVDITGLIHFMKDHNNINFVRFNKRPNWKPHISNLAPGDQERYVWETYLEEKKDISFALMKTDSIATHPHIIRVSKFIEDWIDIASNPQPRLVGAVEQNLYSEYTKDIKSEGFEYAHEKWGVYVYGSKDDDKMITHQDGSDSGRA